MVQGAPSSRNRRQGRGRLTDQAGARLGHRAPCVPQEPGRRADQLGLDPHAPGRRDSTTPKVNSSRSLHAMTKMTMVTLVRWVAAALDLT